MADYSRMINPAAPLETQNQAVIAARAGALAAFILAGSSALSGLILLATAESYAAKLRRMVDIKYGEGSEIARTSAAMMTPSLVHVSAVLSLAVAVGLVVLGLVQWRKLTRPIPLILGLLTLYSLLTVVFNLVAGGPAAAAIQAPVERLILAIIVDILVLVLCWNGFRGSSWLAKLR